jgi:hypothetical protein
MWYRVIFVKALIVLVMMDASIMTFLVYEFSESVPFHKNHYVVLHLVILMRSLCTQ